jgi:hypothetical protein
MRLHSACFISTLGAASAALSFAVAIALPPTGVGPRPAAGVVPAITDLIPDTVNRASKGDRLRVIVRPPGGEPFEVQAPEGPSPKPRDGCESAFGQMDHSSAARLAQSCVT